MKIFGQIKSKPIPFYINRNPDEYQFLILAEGHILPIHFIKGQKTFDNIEVGEMVFIDFELKSNEFKNQHYVNIFGINMTYRDSQFDRPACVEDETFDWKSKQDPKEYVQNNDPNSPF